MEVYISKGSDVRGKFMIKDICILVHRFITCDVFIECIII